MRKLEFLRRAAPLALLPLVAACAGSAPSSLPNWNLSGGEYLTEAEFQKLSTDQALDYCRQLAAELDIQRDNLAAAAEMQPDVQSDVSNLTEDLASLQGSNGSLAADVADLERRLKMLMEMPSAYTVVPGDWLRKIAAQSRIYADEEKWKRIFRANRNEIDDPNLIYPGQMFNIARGAPTSHVVKQGETLRIIAGYWEIYGDRNQSGRIYEANRDKIADPDMIRPGLVLSIPR